MRSRLAKNLGLDAGSDYSSQPYTPPSVQSEILNPFGAYNWDRFGSLASKQALVLRMLNDGFSVQQIRDEISRIEPDKSALTESNFELLGLKSQPPAQQAQVQQTVEPQGLLSNTYSEPQPYNPEPEPEPLLYSYEPPPPVYMPPVQESTPVEPATATVAEAQPVVKTVAQETKSASAPAAAPQSEILRPFGAYNWDRFGSLASKQALVQNMRNDGYSVQQIRDEISRLEPDRSALTERNFELLGLAEPVVAQPAATTQTGLLDTATTVAQPVTASTAATAQTGLTGASGEEQPSQPARLTAIQELVQSAKRFVPTEQGYDVTYDPIKIGGKEYLVLNENTVVRKADSQSGVPSGEVRYEYIDPQTSQITLSVQKPSSLTNLARIGGQLLTTYVLGQLGSGLMQAFTPSVMTGGPISTTGLSATEAATLIDSVQTEAIRAAQAAGISDPNILAQAADVAKGLIGTGLTGNDIISSAVDTAKATAATGAVSAAGNVIGGGGQITPGVSSSTPIVAGGGLASTAGAVTSSLPAATATSGLQQGLTPQQFDQFLQSNLSGLEKSVVDRISEASGLTQENVLNAISSSGGSLVGAINSLGLDVTSTLGDLMGKFSDFGDVVSTGLNQSQNAIIDTIGQNINSKFEGLGGLLTGGFESLGQGLQNVGGLLTSGFENLSGLFKEYPSLLTTALVAAGTKLLDQSKDGQQEVAPFEFDPGKGLSYTQRSAVAPVSPLQYGYGPEQGLLTGIRQPSNVAGTQAANLSAMQAAAPTAGLLAANQAVMDQARQVSTKSALDKAAFYNNLRGQGYSDQQIQNLVGASIGYQTPQDFNYLRQLGQTVQMAPQLQQRTPENKASYFNDLLNSGLNYDQALSVINTGVGQQSNQDLLELARLASAQRAQPTAMVNTAPGAFSQGLLAGGFPSVAGQTLLGFGA